MENLKGVKLNLNSKNYEILNGQVNHDNVIVLHLKETIQNNKKKYVLSELSKSYFKNVHPYLVEVMTNAITDSPYDFRITAGARTSKEQNELYQIGRTRAGTKVTNADGYKVKSNHQLKADGYGYAVDIFVCGMYDENGNYKKFTTQEGYDYKKLKAIADHIKSIAKQKGYNIEWGGDWKGAWDSPHFELKL